MFRNYGKQLNSATRPSSCHSYFVFKRLRVRISNWRRAIVAGFRCLPQLHHALSGIVVYINLLPIHFAYFLNSLFNLLKPNGNYMYHLLYQSVTAFRI
jgi:hypothetical protein